MWILFGIAAMLLLTVSIVKAKMDEEDAKKYRELEDYSEGGTCD
jgi:hypothetical protein